MAEVKKRGKTAPIPYNPAVAERICYLLSTTSDGLEQILEKIASEFDPRPTLWQIWKWLDTEESFQRSYARARELQATVIFDQAQQWAVNTLPAESKKLGERNGKKFVEVSKTDNVQRAQLAVQTMLKRAGHLHPKKYSEKLALAGDADQPLQINVKIVGATTGKKLKPPPEDCT